MSNVRLTWTLPSVSPIQQPIQHTEIAFRVASQTLPWTIQDRVAPDVAQELLFVDVAPGDYEYRAVVVDVDGQRGPEAFANASVPFALPGVVTNLTATVE